MSKKKELKHISVMPWGYWVRFYKDRRAVVARMFKFKDYPSKKECLKAAQKWRDKNKPAPTVFVDNFANAPTKLNKLQILGVCVYAMPRKTSFTYYARAHWGANGKNHSKYFSMTKYGREKAIEMAKDYREKKINEIVEDKSKKKKEKNK